MITYLWGEDSYGAWQAVQALLKQKKAELHFIDSADVARIGAIEALSSSPSLFGTTLNVIRDPFQFPKAIQVQLVEAIKTKADTEAILWDRVGVDKRSSLWLALKKHAKEFPALPITQLTTWISEEAKKHGSVIDNAGANELVKRLGFDRWRLANTIEQLSLKTENITTQEIAALVPAADNPATSFQLLDAIFAGRGSVATTILENLLLAGESEMGILGLLGWQIRSLLFIKLDTDAGHSLKDIASRRAINPFVIEKGVGITRRLSANQLLDALSRLMATDFAIKQGKVDMRTAVVMTVAQLVETNTGR